MLVPQSMTADVGSSALSGAHRAPLQQTDPLACRGGLRPRPTLSMFAATRAPAAGGMGPCESEHKPEVRLPRTWSHGMCSTESGEKVVQSFFIREVEDRKPQSHVIRLGAKKVIRPYAGVEQVAWHDARGIGVVIFCSWLRNAHPRGRELRPRQIAGCYGARQGGQGAAAVQADDGLLVGIQGESAGQVGHRARHQAAIVAPSQDGVGTLLVHVAKVSGLLEGLVVIDAEGARGQRGIEDQPSLLGSKVPRARVAQHGVSGKALDGGHTEANAESVDLAFPPQGRKDNGCAEERVEVGAAAAKLPEVFPVHHPIAAEGLLKSRIKLIAPLRNNRTLSESPKSRARQSPSAG